MEPYQVVFTRAARKELADLLDNTADRIIAAIIQHRRDVYREL